MQFGYLKWVSFYVGRTLATHSSPVTLQVNEDRNPGGVRDHSCWVTAKTVSQSLIGICSDNSALCASLLFRTLVGLCLCVLDGDKLLHRMDYRLHFRRGVEGRRQRYQSDAIVVDDFDGGSFLENLQTVANGVGRYALTCERMDRISDLQTKTF